MREERFTELLAEVDTTPKWDVILLNETWREASEEHIELDGGHVFCGSGGTWEKRRGNFVAFAMVVFDGVLYRAL